MQATLSNILHQLKGATLASIETRVKGTKLEATKRGAHTEVKCRFTSADITIDIELTTDGRTYNFYPGVIVYCDDSYSFTMSGGKCVLTYPDTTVSNCNDSIAFQDLDNVLFELAQIVSKEYKNNVF